MRKILHQPSSFQERVLYIVSLIPKGKVATYGQVALLAGEPGASQAVGYIVHNAAYRVDLPFQRVLNRYGGLAKGYTNGGVTRHKLDVEADGVKVNNDFLVDMSRYLWEPSATILDRLKLPEDVRIALHAKFHA